MRIIGLFFPALISVSIKHARNSEHTWQMPKVLAEYGIYVLINVLITTSAITYGLGLSGVTVDAFESFPFFTKYTIIAIVIAVFAPYIEEIIKRYLKVTFTVRENNETVEKHTESN